MATTAKLQPIPHPPGHALVGNLFDLDAHHPIESLMGLARHYGPIFRIDVPGGNSRVVVSGVDLVDDICDESRFDKALGPGLRALGAGPIGRGLFTSETSDPNWHKAHNILLPAFSQDAIRRYHPMMLDIAVQLMQKWAVECRRHGRRGGRHDAAHARYDRPLRLQLPVQLLLP